jgi:hypothetical protein
VFEVNNYGVPQFGYRKALVELLKMHLFAWHYQWQHLEDKKTSENEIDEQQSIHYPCTRRLESCFSKFAASTRIIIMEVFAIDRVFCR